MHTTYIALLALLIGICFFSLGWAVAWRQLSHAAKHERRFFPIAHCANMFRPPYQRFRVRACDYFKADFESAAFSGVIDKAKCAGCKGLDSIGDLNRFFAPVEPKEIGEREKADQPDQEHGKEESAPWFYDQLSAWATATARTTPFSISEAITEGLGLDGAQMTPALVTRVGIALRKIGCERIEKRTTSALQQRRLYTPPGFVISDFAAQRSQHQSPNQQSEGPQASAPLRQQPRGKAPGDDPAAPLNPSAQP